MSDVSYVRTEMLPERDPPGSTVGVVGWMRENLFSGWFNSILSVVAGAILLWVLYTILSWAVSPTWQAASLNECRDVLHVLGKDGHFAGACWGVIRDRWVQLLFGFYPSEFYWRPILALILLGVALAPVLFSDEVPPKLLWFTAVYPFIFPWLLWGGNIWGPILVMVGLALGYVAYRVIGALAGHLVALILAVAVTVLWWVFAIAPINSALNVLVTNMRVESITADLEARAEALPPEIAKLQEMSDTLGAEIKTQVGSMAALLKKHDQALEDGADPAALSADADAFLAALSALAGPRAEKGAIDTELLKKRQALSDAQATLKQIRELPGHDADVETLTRKAAAGRAALPAALAGITDIKNLPQGTSKEDADALQAVLTDEGNILVHKNAAAETRAKVGRVGLAPVISRNFGGFMLSITIGVVAIACSLPLGIVLALGRQSDLLIVKALCVGFIEFIRGVPLITLLFVASTLLNIFMPPGTNFDIILRVMIMATLFSAAYMAEVIRGGLAALPKGQYEGADSLGLNYWQAQRLVIMPQALKISIPGIVSTFIGMYKDTTLVSIIGLLDPLGLTNAIRADADWNGIVWELYGFVALLFWIGTFSMSRYSMYLERKLNTGHSR